MDTKNNRRTPWTRAAAGLLVGSALTVGWGVAGGAAAAGAASGAPAGFTWIVPATGRWSGPVMATDRIDPQGGVVHYGGHFHY